MRRAIGPIVTTGVAMVAAGVVVANPILAPRGDLQIPAVALSAGTADNMLDKSFLDAIAPAPPESNSPFSVLKQLVSALAADATYLGKNAIVDAFVAGVGAVTGPALSPGTTTYVPPVAPPPALPAAPVVVPPPPDLSSLVPAVAPHVDASVLSSSIAAVPAELANVTSTFINGSVVPVVEQVVSAIAYDATYVGKNVLTAAFAVGAAVAAEPGLIGDTLKALVNGDIKGALQNAVNAVVRAVETPITSSMLIINAVKDIIENHLLELENFFFPIPQGAIVPGVATPEQPAPVVNSRRAIGDLPVTVARTAVSASSMALSSRPAAAKPRASAAVPATRQAAGAVRDALTSVGEQVGAAIQKPAAAAGKATARARAAAAR